MRTKLRFVSSGTLNFDERFGHVNEISGNGHWNFRRNRRSSRHNIAEMFIERLNVISLTDGAQVHRNTAIVHRKFFSCVHELSAKAFALLNWIQAEQTQIHSVLAFLQIDAADQI